MSSRQAQGRTSPPADVVADLKRGGAGTPAQIARRLGPDWTEGGVLALLAELFADGVVNHNHELALWWVA